MSEPIIGEESEILQQDGVLGDVTPDDVPGRSGGLLRLVLFGLLVLGVSATAVAYVAPEVFAPIAEFIPEAIAPKPADGA